MDSWYSGSSNFICAGADCFASLMGNFIDKHGGLNFFDDAKLNHFILNSVDKYLYSFGTGLNYKTQKFSDKHAKRIGNEVQKIIDRSFMDNSKLYIDSGGFQVAMGAVKTPDMPRFINMYHDFLRDSYKKFSYAFTLDLPPGPSSAMDIFDSYQQIEDLNRQSYIESGKLPQDVKDKMIYIHHFRTPSLYNTWKKFLWDENLAEGFKNFATGGIVANSATDISIPAIIYSIPLSEILKYAISRNMKEFNFHVLGGANFIDVFYHKLFSYHIKKVHDIQVNITYDSSAIFKALAIGRFVPVFTNGGNLMKMDLRSKGLHLRFDELDSVETKTYSLLNDIASHYEFKQLNPDDDPIYAMAVNKAGIERETLNRSVHMYLICYFLRAYRHLEFISSAFVEEIYPLYEQGDIVSFDDKCYAFAQRTNQGKKTRKQKAKISSIYKSLNILTELDTDYNQHLIQKFMSNDDITMMSGEGLLKF